MTATLKLSDVDKIVKSHCCTELPHGIGGYYSSNLLKSRCTGLQTRSDNGKFGREVARERFSFENHQRFRYFHVWGVFIERKSLM